jgi:hypothetical protein
MVDTYEPKHGDWIKIKKFFEDEWFRVELGTYNGTSVGFFNHKAGVYGEILLTDVMAVYQ